MRSLLGRFGLQAFKTGETGSCQVILGVLRVIFTLVVKSFEVVIFQFRKGFEGGIPIRGARRDLRRRLFENDDLHGLAQKRTDFREMQNLRIQFAANPNGVHFTALIGHRLIARKVDRAGIEPAT
jgi:hypothetical protein